MRALALLLLLPTLVSAQTIRLAWDYPRDRNPEAFVVTTDGSTQLTYRTDPSAAGACPGEASPDTYCTNLPSCPPAGVVRFFVAAVEGGVTGPTNGNELTCLIPPGACACLGLSTPTTVTPATTSAASVETPGVASPPASGGTQAQPSTSQQAITIPQVPTQEPASLPPVQTAPALPAFAPAASQAPV